MPASCCKAGDYNGGVLSNLDGGAMKPEHDNSTNADLDAEALSAWEWEGGFIDLRYDNEKVSDTSKGLLPEARTPDPAPAQVTA
jgi:hypothetical protein